MLGKAKGGSVKESISNQVPIHERNPSLGALPQKSRFAACWVHPDISLGAVVVGHCSLLVGLEKQPLTFHALSKQPNETKNK